MKTKRFTYSAAVFLLPLLSVLLLWVIYWMQIRLGFDFYEHGIFPRTFLGLQGVVFSPFIHADLHHLLNNSLPLLVLLAALRFFYPQESLPILFYGMVFSGFFTWLIGRPDYHIGASGLIYVLVSFIFFKGMQSRYYRLMALSFAVVVMYGGMVWYVFPDVDETMSWEGHLSGLLVGFLLSLFYKLPELKKVIKYYWEDPNFDPSSDPFMRQFDANGNFIPYKEEVEVEEQQNFSDNYFNCSHNVTYDVRKQEPES